MPHATGWAALPPDLIEVILDHLSCLDLARLSSVSPDFRAAFYRQLGSPQTPSSPQAAYWFGHERLRAMVSFIDRYFKGEALHLEWPNGPEPACYVMLEDGVMIPANDVREVCRILGDQVNLSCQTSISRFV